MRREGVLQYSMSPSELCDSQKGSLVGRRWFGATPQALKDLVEQYGYSLVYCESSAVNCFFVLDAPEDMVTELHSFQM